jgi:hypothetical protein
MDHEGSTVQVIIDSTNAYSGSTPTTSRSAGPPVAFPTARTPFNRRSAYQLLFELSFFAFDCCQNVRWIPRSVKSISTEGYTADARPK